MAACVRAAETSESQAVALALAADPEILALREGRSAAQARTARTGMLASPELRLMRGGPADGSGGTRADTLKRRSALGAAPHRRAIAQHGHSSCENG